MTDIYSKMNVLQLATANKGSASCEIKDKAV